MTKKNITKLHKVETLQAIHTDQNAIKLEMKNATKNQKVFQPDFLKISLNSEKEKENINKNYQTSEKY